MDVVYGIQLSKIGKIQTVHFNRLNNITREGNYDPLAGKYKGYPLQDPGKIFESTMAPNHAGDNIREIQRTDIHEQTGVLGVVESPS